jgi:hypothetical protein
MLGSMLDSESLTQQAWVHVSTKPLEPAVATTLGRFLAEAIPTTTPWKPR